VLVRVTIVVPLGLAVLRVHLAQTFQSIVSHVLRQEGRRWARRGQARKREEAPRTSVIRDVLPESIRDAALGYKLRVLPINVLIDVDLGFGWMICIEASGETHALAQAAWPDCLFKASDGRMIDGRGVVFRGYQFLGEAHDWDLSFFKAYLIYFHPTDGVQCGIGKLISSAETLNLGKEAAHGQREEGADRAAVHPWQRGAARQAVF
jgi:hypothetical protein